MNLPNKLTLSRLILTVVFVVCFHLPTIANPISIALIIFAIASITDYLDGEMARRRNLVTNFGKLFDPLADKILMTAALVVLAVDKTIPGWIVITILAREFFVTGIRQIAAHQGAVLAAEQLGKHKMVWQIITVCYFMLHAATGEPIFAWAAPLFSWPPTSPAWFGAFCIYFTAFLTVASGFSYFWKNRRLFADA